MSINFESTRKKAVEREQLREARSVLLEKAKADFERKEKAKELAKSKGEGTWMLPSLSDRIDQDQKELEKAKKKKKKSKKKKEKKEKKKKKKKKKGSSDDSSSSESDSESGGEPMWVEKTSAQKKDVAEAPTAVKGPKLERDSWMTEAPGFFPCTSRAEIREQKRKEKEQETAIMDQMGQHEKELNPYWKDGGTGMPDEQKKATAPSSVAGDGGVSWLRKAYQRCVERAKEEGKSLEDVASAQYGSLEKLESMIAEAEEKAGLRRGRGGDGNRRRDGERGFSGRRSRSRDRRRRSASRDRDSRDKHMSASRDRDSRDKDNRDRRRSRSRDRDRRDNSRERDSQRQRNRSRSRDRQRNRSRSRSRDPQRNRSRSRDRSRRDRESERSSGLSSKLKGRFMKPGDMDSSSSNSHSRRSPERSSSSSWRKRGFMKPGESRDSPPRRRDSPPRMRDSPSRRRDSPSRRPRHHRSASSSSSSSDSEDERPMKKRFAFSKPKDHSDDEGSAQYERKPVGAPRWKKPDASGTAAPGDNAAAHGKGKPRRHSSSESGDSESESSASDSDSAPPDTQKAQEEEAPVVVLSEDEMNKLGAKLMKAELMGNTALAEKLKAQLESVRKAKEMAGIKTTAAAERKQQKEEKEENVVVLTRTDRAGNVRPLVDLGDGPSGGNKKKRTKKKNVTTHGKQGERERYFDDDDKYDLKSMVAREKLSTAEDSNAMFARLAGRGIERTDDDYQIDDVFMSRAAGMQSESQINDREKLTSVMESRKVQSAMEKCHFCFDNVPKHLIVAIGLKVYLCLPNHRSMADGHCLIVPMQHVTSGTQVDEDVWAEIQIFRKGLTRMFADDDEDVAFMETSMNLRRHPHMVLEAVPMPREVGDMAPIYFKKAIMDTGSEWAQNKKVVDLSQKDVRQAVPKGFPYFAVDFGMQGGFAHVIEEEKDFPSYFGREICGGMMELGPELWRKPHKENFDAQREKVLKFAKMWQPYDWTQKLKAKVQEDSD